MKPISCGKFLVKTLHIVLSFGCESTVRYFFQFVVSFGAKYK